jgi:cyclophilin family peptidyl-prolyl cis-trans isomerase/HEAT repeat protein
MAGQRKIRRRMYLAFFKHASILNSFNFSFSILFGLPVWLLLAGCETNDNPINKFSDPVIAKIADLKDRRLADSLVMYFHHENATYRQEAVEAFGSVQSGTDVDKIGKLLLMDTDPAVRRCAAFAMGQAGQQLSSERLLLAALVKEKIPENIFEILQAYGKVTGRWKLEHHAFSADTTTMAGFAWSLYRAGLRGKTNSAANLEGARLLGPGFSRNTRLGAAHFFARGTTGFDNVARYIREAAAHDNSPDVRMAAAQALGKIPSDSTLAVLKQILQTEKDPRVLVNSLRALKAFPYDAVKNYLYDAVRHSNDHVGIAASETILDIITESNWIEVSALTNQVEQWRIRANLFEAVLKASQHQDVAAEIQGLYKSTVDPYQRAALLASLKHYPPAAAFVSKELVDADTPVVRSTAASALVAMNYSAAFPRDAKLDFAKTYEAIMQSQSDPAVLGTIASALADSALGYRDILGDPGFLYEARKKLRLPEHIEALQPIEAAIAHFEERKPAPVENQFNHPTNWSMVARIPEGQRVVIKTTRGNIVIRLLVDEAPGSVANFVSLATKGYYNNKFFHRVVPNFVIQAGCDRGDGWGSENYSIRSEFSPRVYTRGSVGMASAGKDTEGTQWFITHCPTPHLDGRYTIFAEVEEGMRVVDYIQVGDKIIDVVVENFKAQ